jgi:hypothetical protein
VSPQQATVDALDRQLKALELRKGGVSYEEIARVLGYKNKAGPFYAVKRALERVKAEPAKELIVLECERLDSLFWAIYPMAKRGSLGAVDRCLSIMARRARLLGLDAPEKQDITGVLEIVVVREQPDKADNGEGANPAPKATSD